MKQELDHRVRTVVSHFQPDFVAEVALQQFALQRCAQMLRRSKTPLF